MNRALTASSFQPRIQDRLCLYWRSPCFHRLSLEYVERICGDWGLGFSLSDGFRSLHHPNPSVDRMPVILTAAILQMNIHTLLAYTTLYLWTASHAHCGFEHPLDPMQWLTAGNRWVPFLAFSRPPPTLPDIPFPLYLAITTCTMKRRGFATNLSSATSTVSLAPTRTRSTRGRVKPTTRLCSKRTTNSSRLRLWVVR